MFPWASIRRTRWLAESATNKLPLAGSNAICEILFETVWVALVLLIRQRQQRLARRTPVPAEPAHRSAVHARGAGYRGRYAFGPKLPQQCP
jgi:hypothetical protein